VPELEYVILARGPTLICTLSNLGSTIQEPVRSIFIIIRRQSGRRRGDEKKREKRLEI
jgi:hypothetical protein